MAPDPIPLLGGKSVHCINEQQMAEAHRLFHEDPETAGKLHKWVEQVESALNRNERAALAFILIQRLKETAEGS